MATLLGAAISAVAAPGDSASSPVAQKPVAPQTQASTATPAPQPAAETPPADADNKPYCFKVSRLCIKRKLQADDGQTTVAQAGAQGQAPAAPAAAKPAASAKPAAQPAPATNAQGSAPSLDLQVKQEYMGELMTQVEENQKQAEIIDEVKVIEKRPDKPARTVPEGVGSLIWAVRHPKEAWRIFLPSAATAEEAEKKVQD